MYMYTYRYIYIYIYILYSLTAVMNATMCTRLCHYLKLDVKPRARILALVTASDACCQHVISLALISEVIERVPLWTPADRWRETCDGVQTKPEAAALRPQDGHRHGGVVPHSLFSLHLPGLRLTFFLGGSGLYL